MKLIRLLAKAIAMLILSLTLLAVVAFAALCLAVDGYGRVDRAQHADVIVVLGAEVLPNGSPGPNLQARIEKAVTLFQAGYAPRLICAGGIAGDELSAAAVARRRAAELGVPDSAILLADGSNNTREDARRSAEVMAASGWRRAVVVSHPLHLLRVTMRFRQIGIETYPSPTNTEVRRIPLRLRAFYSVREASLIVFDLLYAEDEPPHWVAEAQRWFWRSGLDRLGHDLVDGLNW